MRDAAPQGRALHVLGWRWLCDRGHERRAEWDKLYEFLLTDGFQISGFLSAGQLWCLSNKDKRQTPGLAAAILVRSGADPARDELATWLAWWVRRNVAGETASVIAQILQEARFASTEGWMALKDALQ